MIALDDQTQIHYTEIRRLKSSNMECGLSMPMQRVLIVEDMPDVREVMRDAIAITGLYAIDLAGNTDEAMAIFEPGKYFAVLMDLHLGNSIDEGIALAVHFRKEDDNVFLAALSGYYPVFDERLLLSVDDFLEKPIDYDFLCSKLLMWQIKHARRIALKHYVEERVMSYKKCLNEILEEEFSIREQLHDLIERTGIRFDGGESD